LRGSGSANFSFHGVQIDNPNTNDLPILKTVFQIIYQRKGIQKEQHQMHNIHDRQRERSVVPAESIPEKSVFTALNLHPDHMDDRAGI
jgi:hypothetical protein